MPFHFGDRDVARVRHDLPRLRRARRVPMPCLRLVATIAVGVREVADVDLVPERVRRRSECRHAALGRDTSAGEDDDAPRLPQQRRRRS